MGLTHSWRRATQLDAGAFNAAARDLERLFGTGSITIAGPDGIGEPIITPSRIAFNGVTPQSCEPFEISVVEHDRHGRVEVFAFCKTEHLPYDKYVRAALIVLQHHLGDALRVSSDVKNDWSQTQEFVINELGYGGEFTLST